MHPYCRDWLTIIISLRQCLLIDNLHVTPDTSYIRDLQFSIKGYLKARDR